MMRSAKEHETLTELAEADALSGTEVPRDGSRQCVEVAEPGAIRMAAKRSGWRPRTRYERLTVTQDGRSWLTLHPECQLAHDLATRLRELEDELCKKALANERRASIKNDLVRLDHAMQAFEPSITGRRQVMLQALEASATYLRVATIPHVKYVEETGAVFLIQSTRTREDILSGQVEAARQILGFAHLARAPDDVVRKAVDAWPSRGKGKWVAIWALAKALGCTGDTTAETFRVQFVPMLRAMRYTGRVEERGVVAEARARRDKAAAEAWKQRDLTAGNESAAVCIDTPEP